MTKDQFREWANERVRVLDGATGTQLQKMGMPLNVCPEKWVLENPDALIEIQQDYIRSGAELIYTCTFGGNGLKLKESGIQQVVEYNRDLALLSKKAAEGNALVAGDIAPTGVLMAPFGMYSFEDIVKVYKEQVRGLLEGGVDLFVIETMMDIQEARAALLAVKESCDLPVMVTMTFERGGRTINGTDPLTALITLQSLGADAVGCNCSTGPGEMLEVMRELKPFAKVPLIAKPNAGMPKLVDGKTIFDMGADEFSSYAEDFVDAGVGILGGCCGTSPEYIQRISDAVKGKKCSGFVHKNKTVVLSSARRTVGISSDLPICIIGERINPTGKKKLQEDLRAGSMELVIEYAMEQIGDGALVLDVNAGIPDIDEVKTLTEMASTLSTMVQVPLCFDSSSPEALESALRVYPGRALINSVSAEEVKLKEILPVAAKYGAAFILLPVDDKGVPEKAEDRIEIIKNVYQEARKYGYSKSDFLVDGLVMTIASNQAASLETMKVLQWSYNDFGANTVLGLSNISYGLPERPWINTAFLAMAASHGLSAVIMNPCIETLMHIKRAADALTGKDRNSIHYIKKYGRSKVMQEEKRQEDPIYNAILDGSRADVLENVRRSLDNGVSPGDIVDKHLIPAITQVGELYQQRTYFLPQLIQSAEAMEAAMEYLEPLLKQKSMETTKGKVVLATVKGDIHDIGKNIVGLMLKNYGFDVIDLGKDVDTDRIIKTARDIQADIIGLSALMTTTMVEMREVVKKARKEDLKARILIGGAAVNEGYAKEIGADAYAPDAYMAVKQARLLL